MYLSNMLCLTGGGGLQCVCVPNVVYVSQSSDQTGQDIQTIILIDKGWGVGK